MKSFLFAVIFTCISYARVQGLSWLFGTKIPSKTIFEAIEENDIDGCREALLEPGAVNERLGSETPLHKASELGNELIYKLLIEKKAKIEARDHKGVRPLHIACGKGDMRLCQFLIDKGADIHANTSNYYVMKKKNKTPLHFACFQAGKSSVCQLLIDNSAHIQAKDSSGLTPLHDACESGNELVCRLLIDRGADTNAKDLSGLTPLHNACESGNESVCRLLIDQGADLNAQSTSGKTPLHIASCNGNELVCKILLDNGADFTVADEEGKTPIFRAHESCAGKKENKAAFDLLWKKVSKVANDDTEDAHPLHWACNHDYQELCHYFIWNGTGINAQDRTGKTPLMICCEQGNKTLCLKILKNPKLIKERKDFITEGTALHWACENNRLEICEALLEAGFNSNETADSQSLLHIAIRNNNQRLFDLFLTEQSDVNKQEKEGETPLHWACSLGKVNFVKAVLEKKGEKNVDIDIQNVSGKTPLHCAVDKGQVQIVRLLLAYGAKPNISDIYRKTPIMYAAEYGKVEICKLLKRKIPVVVFNIMKSHVAQLIQGNEELEKIFGLTYDTVPSCPPDNSFAIDENYAPVLVNSQEESDATESRTDCVTFEHSKENYDEGTAENIEQTAIYSSSHSYDPLSDTTGSDDKTSILLAGE